MLIRLRLPPNYPLEPLASSIIPDKYPFLPNTPLRCYKTPADVAPWLEIAEEEVFPFTALSSTMHGLILPDRSLRIHPTTFYKTVAIKFKRLLSRSTKDVESQMNQK